MLTARANKRNKGYVQVANIVSARFVAKLSDCLKEWKDLDVADCSTNLRNNYISIIRCNTTNTALNFIGDVWNYLNGLSQVITTTLCSQYCLINRTSCCVGTASEILVNEAFVVPKVKVSFAAIVSNKNFTMLKWVHRARVNVDVGIKFLHCHA